MPAITPALPAKEEQLLSDVLSYADDPAGFVSYIFPWEEPDTPLASAIGPENWHLEVFDYIRERLTQPEPIRIAIASGHGTAKTTFLGQLAYWFLSTKPHAQVRITASTANQLSTVTWRELAYWHGLALNNHWFHWTATRLYRQGFGKTWYASAIPWSAERPQSFAGAHAQHLLIGMDEACHDDQTDVLTDHGWKRFAVLDGTERLLTMNPVTFEAEYVAPIKLYRAHRTGPMRKYRQRAGSFCVTPNHELFLRPRKASIREGKPYGFWGDYTRIRAGQLPRIGALVPRSVQWQGAKPALITIPAMQGARKYFPARTVPTEAFLALLGWFFSEGSIDMALRAGERRAYRVCISQSPGPYLERIVELVSLCGYHPSVSPGGRGEFQVRFGDYQLATWLATMGEGCLVKRIPRWVFGFAPAYLWRFLEAYKCGDGYNKEDAWVLYTSNPGLADDLQEMAFLAGAQASVTRRPLRGVVSDLGTHLATSTVDGYVIRINFLETDLYLNPKNFQDIDYDGMVYCAELPKHHLLFTRRDGFCMWSGNSTIDDAVWEVVDGAMSTICPIWVAVGNPEKASGRFRECFGRFRSLWQTWQVDARKARITNKAEITRQIEAYGLDSDFVRVRWLGLFPRADVTTFISETLVAEAQARTPAGYEHMPKVLGVDVGGMGTAATVLTLRQGVKIHWIRDYHGLRTDQVADEVAHILLGDPEVVMAFVDVVGIGAGVHGDLMRMGFQQRIMGVISGATGTELLPGTSIPKYFNLRAQCWGKGKEWLEQGGCLPPHPQLAQDLIAPKAGYAGERKLQLESKDDMRARGVASPDYGDSFMFTFARPVAPRPRPAKPEGLATGWGQRLANAWMAG